MFLTTDGGLVFIFKGLKYISIVPKHSQIVYKKALDLRTNQGLTCFRRNVNDHL